MPRREYGCKRYPNTAAQILDFLQKTSEVHAGAWSDRKRSKLGGLEKVVGKRRLKFPQCTGFAKHSGTLPQDNS